MEKTQKTNKPACVAAVVVVGVLVTACMLGATFAKYSTSVESSDNARVAHWGFGESTTTFQLFDKTYNDGKVSSSQKVIAPGTSGETALRFVYDGSTTNPEVDYQFTIDAGVDEGASYAALDANDNFVWTIQYGNEEKRTYKTVADLIAGIKALSGETAKSGEATGTKTYEAGKLPSIMADSSNPVKIGWSWAGSTSDAQDAKDTAMGNATTLDNLNLWIKVSAVQILA